MINDDEVDKDDMEESGDNSDEVGEYPAAKAVPNDDSARHTTKTTTVVATKVGGNVIFVITNDLILALLRLVLEGCRIVSCVLIRRKKRGGRSHRAHAARVCLQTLI